MSGTVAVTDTDDGIKIEGTAVGLPGSTSGGFHIHSGVSCDTTDDPGGHYYDGMSDDPWTTTYTSDASGVGTNFIPNANSGRVGTLMMRATIPTQR